MASGAALQRLQHRATQADALLQQLREQVKLLRNGAVADACKDEEAQLRNENENLRKEANNLRNRLIAAEMKNGVKQVALPRAPTAGALSTSPGAAAAAMNKPAETKAESPQQPQQQKKKEKKPAAKGENKGKQGGGGASDRPIDVSMLNMRIGHIVNVKKHPDADTLYVEEVDLGEERNRTIVSGLVKHVPIEQMQDRTAIFCCNLKPAKMRGIMSEGMIMCGSSPEQVEIIEPPAGSVKGERVVVEGFPGEPEPLLPPKKKLFEQIQPDLRINEEGVATYKGGLWRVEGREGQCTVPNMRNSGIK